MYVVFTFLASDAACWPTCFIQEILKQPPPVQHLEKISSIQLTGEHPLEYLWHRSQNERWAALSQLTTGVGRGGWSASTSRKNTRLMIPSGRSPYTFEWSNWIEQESWSVTSHIYSAESRFACKSCCCIPTNDSWWWDDRPEVLDAEKAHD